MKRETILNTLTGGILGFLLAFGGTGCLVSAFDLTVGSMGDLALILGGICLMGSLLFMWKYGGIAALGLLALAAGWLWRDGRAEAQFWDLLYQISVIYDRAYGCGVLRMVPELSGSEPVFWPVGLYGAAAGLGTAWAVCRRTRLTGCLITALLPLASCVVVTDTVPQERYLLAVMGSVILLILTGSVRRENCRQGLRLTAIAAAPTCIALLALFLAVPQNGYVNHSADFRERTLAAFRNFPASITSERNPLTGDLPHKAAKQVDLSALGPRPRLSGPVMDIISQKSGTLYLRGQDFDTYDGRQWIASKEREEPFPAPEGERWTVTIHTRNRRDVIYFPGYPQPSAMLTGGSWENTNADTDYTLSCVTLPGDWRRTAYLSSAAEISVDSRYLTLPEQTRRQAETFLRGLFPDEASPTEKADAIAALVTGCAEYDLNAAPMPDGQKDFALWFLAEGEKGYCVHFATAATVLLRSAGVPARYVAGYTADVTAGRMLTVTEESAHAWAEYYEPSLQCWIPLEATPAAPEQTAAASSAATEETPPESTGSEVQPEIAESIPPSAPSVPQETPPAGQEKADEKKMPSFLYLAAGIFLLLPVPALQRRIRMTLRRRRLHGGSVNQQALARWREAERLSVLLKESPPEELIILAQKAKFSQYELTPEELQTFDSHIRSCCRRMRKKPLFQRLFYKYIHAAI